MTLQLRSEEQALPPAQRLDAAKELSTALLNMVEQTKAFAVIQGKRYLQVEAWQFIGAANHVSPMVERVTPVEENGVVVAYEAKVNLIDQDGIVVGGGIMECGLDEFVTQGKTGRAKHLAAKSMAETRATSKAFRLKYSWVAMLGGFQPTTAEEMWDGDRGGFENTPPESGEHWCETHGVKFFKTGRMKGYAHPIGDTNQWCNESKSNPGNPSSKTPREKPQNARTEAKVIDHDPLALENIRPDNASDFERYRDQEGWTAEDIVTALKGLPGMTETQARQKWIKENGVDCRAMAEQVAYYVEGLKDGPPGDGESQPAPGAAAEG